MSADDDLQAFFAKREELRRQAGLDDTPFPLERDEDPVDTQLMESAPLETDERPTRNSYQDRITELQSGTRGVDHITAGHLAHVGELLESSLDTQAQLLAEVRAVRQMMAQAGWWAMALSSVVGIAGILAGLVAIAMAVGRAVVG